MGRLDKRRVAGKDSLTNISGYRLIETQTNLCLNSRNPPKINLTIHCTAESFLREVILEDAIEAEPEPRDSVLAAESDRLYLDFF